MITSTTVESPESTPMLEIPPKYKDLNEVFSKTKASGLPNHQT